MTHQHHKRSFVPHAVLTKSGKLSTADAAVNTVKTVNTANTKAVNTIRSVNTAASKPIVNHPRIKTNTFKRGYSQSLRPFNLLEVSASVINDLFGIDIPVRLPPKEKDPRSFILPCTIANMTVSNALADLGASISVIDVRVVKTSTRSFTIP
ncbi:hypothetical protein Tco_0535436 [Tanacetum coccineum]